MVRHFGHFTMLRNHFGSPDSDDAILRNVSAILEQQEQLDYKESPYTTHMYTFTAYFKTHYLVSRFRNSNG